MAFTDVLGDYLQNRWNTATQPFTDPEAYLRQRLLDEEEERKKREREEAARKAAEEQAAQQRAVEQAQTPTAPTTQPGQPAYPGESGAAVPTGMAAPNQFGSAIAQGQTTEGPVPGGPVAPEPANIQQQRQLQQAPGQQMTMDERIAAAAQRAQERAAQQSAPQQQAAPQPAPAPAPAPVQQVAQPAPVAPAVPAPPMAAPAAPQLPQFGPGVQVASTEPGAGVAEAAQAAQPAPSPWAAKLEAGKNDLSVLGQILASDAPEDIKSEAQDRLFNMKLDREQQKKADKLFAGVQSGDPKAVNDLTRELKTRTEEGSLFKAYVFARLGLNKLADEEQMKLGAGTTYTSFMGPDGQSYTVKVNGRGGVEKAFDATGKAVDDSKIAELNAGYMAMKGAETGKQQFKDSDGNIWTFTTVPGRPGGIYTNTSTGKQSMLAPKGLVPLTYQNPLERAAIQAGKQVMDKMRAENAHARAQGAPEPFSEADILAKGDAASSAIYQGRGTPTTTVSGMGGAEPVSAAGSDLSEGLRSKIVSGGRSTAEQQALYDESVRAGRPGRTATGLPIAKPGTSQHEKNNAIDMPRDLSDEEIAELVQKGYRRSKSDPVHWEKTGGAAPSTARAPAVAAVRQQAEAIYNGDEKAPQGMGAANSRARAVMDEVHRIAEERGAPYDPTKYAAKEKTRKDFSGSGQASKSVQAMNVAIDHLDTLHDAGAALQNGNVPLFNKISNSFAKNTGYPEVTDFNGIKSIVGSEVAKAVAGGQMALADREEIRRELDAANSPAQLNGVIRRFQQLMAGQLSGLRTTYESAGLTDFDKKLNPRTREVLQRGESAATPMSPQEKARAEIERRRKGQQ